VAVEISCADEDELRSFIPSPDFPLTFLRLALAYF
jgi:hypothetical protein